MLKELEKCFTLHFITYILFTEPDLIQNKSYRKKAMDDSYRRTETEE